MSTRVAHRRSPDAAPIPAFWRWWGDGGRSRVTAAIATGEWGDLPSTIAAKVDAIHPQLGWEVAPGIGANHVLVVTAAGDPELRPIAARWIRSAPPRTAEWEFAVGRLRDPRMHDRVLETGGHRLDLALTRFAAEVDETRQRIDVAVHHPELATLAEDDRMRVVFLVLDGLLGEDDVERWVGGLSIAPAAESAPLTGERLAEAVADLATRHAVPEWQTVTARYRTGEMLLAAMLRPLHRLDHPTLDLHSAVAFAYEPVGIEGLPDEQDLAELWALQDELERAVGGRGLVTAHETSRGTRLLHVFTDGEDQNGRDAIDRFARARARVRVAHDRDPRWSALDDLTALFDS